jgi:hypothetical protein
VQLGEKVVDKIIIILYNSIMKIPEIFFGNKKNARSRLNIIVNKLFKKNLQEQFEEIGFIDTDSLDNFIINYETRYCFSDFKNCFYLSELAQLLFRFDRHSPEEMFKIVDENIGYLTKTSWGNLILNNSTNYFLINDYKYNYAEFYNEISLNRNRCIMILKGILENYNEYEINKNNIFSITDEKFPNIGMFYHYVMANCQIEDTKIGFDYSNILDIYEKIIDNNYWDKLLEKRGIKIKSNKEKRKAEHEKWLNEEIKWYKNEMENKKI